jgi:hypothetical protein
VAARQAAGDRLGFQVGGERESHMNQIHREEAVEGSEAEQSPISPAPGRAGVGRGKAEARRSQAGRGRASEAMEIKSKRGE